ncbi:MAG: thioredoxin family protein [Bacteroidia bacterium]|nr:thioredoxin family protein [Bacteroidia bacterium]
MLLGLFYPAKGLAQLQTFHFDQLDSLRAIEQKPVLVFIHTEWCKYCYQMENTTFTNDSLVNRVNRSFYFVKLDAETKENIRYGGHTFKFKPNGSNTGVHELAEQLGTIDGKLAYPTVCLLNQDNEIVYQYSGLLGADALLAGLNQLTE